MHFFALLERLLLLWHRASSPPAVEERLDVIAQFAGELRNLGPANFLYADGEVLFVHGHRRIQAQTGNIEPPGLWLLSRSCALANEPLHGSGISVAAGSNVCCS
jgi:hypothetical protein